MTRTNSNFSALVEHEKDSAREIFDGTLLQKEVPDAFTYEFPERMESKANNLEIQNQMMLEEIKAKEILKEMRVDTLAKDITAD